MELPFPAMERPTEAGTRSSEWCGALRQEYRNLERGARELALQHCKDARIRLPSRSAPINTMMLVY